RSIQHLSGKGLEGRRLGGRNVQMPKLDLTAIPREQKCSFHRLVLQEPADDADRFLLGIGNPGNSEQLNLFTGLDAYLTPHDKGWVRHRAHRTAKAGTDPLRLGDGMSAADKAGPVCLIFRRSERSSFRHEGMRRPYSLLTFLSGSS